jgi:cytochrome c556
MRTRPPAFLLAALIGGLLAMPAVQAQRGADPVKLVEQRQARMKALGASMKTLSAFAKGEAGAPDAQKAADVLAAGGKAMPGWWARGTAIGVSDSEAAPAIWTDPAGFRKQLAAFQRASAQMRSAARTGDVAKVGAELRSVGGTCKGCHDGFRKED